VQVVISALIAGLGLVSAHALSQIDGDLQIMYREYTLAAILEVVAGRALPLSIPTTMTTTC
jgi:hypothetical protein